MTRLSLALAGTVCWFACGIAFAQPAAGPSVQPVSARPVLTFEENRGQVDARFRFLTRDGGHTVYLRADGYSLVLPSAAGYSARRGGSITESPETLRQAPAHVIRARLHGADPSARCRGQGPRDTRSHYLFGSDPSRWQVDVPHYERVVCEGVYAGIDVAYYGHANGLEFDFILAPKADPAQIRLAFEGVEGLDLDSEGDLLLRTPDRLVRQSKPTTYQVIAGETVPVAGGYVVRANNQVGFEVANYDPAEPLVIDPVINWATFLGGSADDIAEAVAVDADGNVYVTGRTSSIDFPAGGGLEDDYQGGPVDAFVAKLSADGTQLIFATYLGGTGVDLGGGIAVDDDGNVFVSGTTNSADFPTTLGSFQPALGGAADAFVVKLNPQGSGLVYSTFLGGPAQDLGDRMRLDAEGSAYVTGNTDGTGFPTTEGAFQTTHGGQFDAFVAKLDAAGANLIFSTLFGGNGSEIPADIEVNRFGEAHIAGIASSTDFPGTPGAYQEQVVVGTFDAFVAKFDATGSALEYFSYLGGSGSDEASGLSLDSLGNVWLSGGAESQDFPTTADAPFPNFHGGPSDGFLARLPLPLGPMVALEAEGVAGDERPSIAPLVTYVGDELRNFGLDVLVVTLGEPTGLAAERAKGPGLSTFIDSSLSNFADTPVVRDGQTISGPFWTYWNLDFNGNLLGDPLTAPGADAFELVGDGGGGVIAAGAGLDNAPTTDGTADPDPNGATDAWAVNVRLTQARVEIEKKLLESLDGRLPVIGDLRTFRIIVRNTGSEFADNVRVRELTENMDLSSLRPSKQPLPTDVNFAIFPCRRVSGSEGLCTIGILEPGETYSFEVNVFLGKGQTKNTAQVTWDNRGMAEASNTVAVLGRAKLELLKEIVGNPATVGPFDTLKYLVEVRNVGDEDAVNVHLEDRSLGAGFQPFGGLPPNQVVVQPESSTVTCVVPAFTFLVCNTDLLRAGEGFIFFVHAKVQNSVGVRNSAEVHADNVFTVTALSDVKVSLDRPASPIRCQPDPSTSKRVSLREGGISELVEEITVTCEDAPQSGFTADVLLDAVPSNIMRPKRINVMRDVFGDSVLIPGNPEPQDRVLQRPGETPAGNENMFLPLLVPGTQAGSTSLFWENVPINPDANGNFSFQVTNLRVDASGLNFDDSFQSDFTFLPKQVGPTKVKVDFFADVRPDSYFLRETLTPRIWRVGVGENWRGSFKKRIETTGGPEPLGTPVRTSGPSFPSGTNSGFIPADDVFGDPADPNAVGAATNGNRFYIEVAGVPAEVLVAPFPGCISSDAFSQTGPGGRIELRRVDGFNDDFSGGSLTPNCDDFTPLPGLESFRLNYEVVGPSGVTGTDVLDSFDIPFSFNCAEGAAGQGSIHIGPGPIVDAATFGDPPVPIPGFAPMTGRVLEFDWANACQGRAFQPVIVAGVANSATFRPEDLPAPGALISLGLQNGEVIPIGSANRIPLPEKINDVEVFVDLAGTPPQLGEDKKGLPPAGQEAFVRAPLLFVSPTQLNLQMPWEIDPNAGVVEAVVVANGIASDPIELPVAPFSPGIFTFDFGPGRAVATNLDATGAQAEGALDDYGLPARPVRIGDFLVILATGLGAVDPAAVTGDDSLDEDGNFVQRNTVTLPRVFIGGVEAQVVFSGLSPQFPGVYQLNVIVGDGTPVGDAVSLVIEIGGVRSRDDVTIAVAPAG